MIFKAVYRVCVHLNQIRLSSDCVDKKFYNDKHYFSPFPADVECRGGRGGGGGGGGGRSISGVGGFPGGIGIGLAKSFLLFFL